MSAAGTDSPSIGWARCECGKKIRRLRLRRWNEKVSSWGSWQHPYPYEGLDREHLAVPGATL